MSSFFSHEQAKNFALALRVSSFPFEDSEVNLTFTVTNGIAKVPPFYLKVIGNSFLAYWA